MNDSSCPIISHDSTLWFSRQAGDRALAFAPIAHQKDFDPLYSLNMLVSQSGDVSVFWQAKLLRVSF
jgi:hypothetical protein